MEDRTSLILAEASKYATIKDWKIGGKFQGIAYKISKDFYKKCTAHMTKWEVWKTLTADYVISSARKYRSKKEWVAEDYHAWLAAKHRGKQFYYQCVEHMQTRPNPLNLPYIVYAYEFEDHTAYIGITYRPEQRVKEHTKYGRHVAKRIKLGVGYAYRVLQTDIYGYAPAGQAEDRWTAEYKSAGWSMLSNKACGSVGRGKTGPLFKASDRVSNDELRADAAKYRRRQDWYAANSYWYTAARKRGILDWCCTDMEPYVDGRKSSECHIKAAVTRAARGTVQKWAPGAKEAWRAHISATLRGRTMPTPWRAKISAAKKGQPMPEVTKEKLRLYYAARKAAKAAA